MIHFFLSICLNIYIFKYMHYLKILKMIGWFEKNRIVSLIITLIILSLIFYISSLRFSNTGQTSNNLSYIYHFTAFSYLTLFLLITLTKGKPKPLLIFLSLFLAFTYAVSDELHQHFVPGRTLSIKDIFTDSLGIFITTLAYNNYSNNKKK